MDDVDALFLAPPEGFVAARDALAARLKAAGDRDGAAAVAALRRPTLAAWAVNAAVRRAPGQLEALLELRTALIRAQRQVLSGVKADLAGLTRQRRQLVEDMVAQAEAAAAEAGRDLGAQREAVRLSFEAAVADEDAAAAVRSGRLAKALPGPAGFGTLAGLSAVPDADPGVARRDPASGRSAAAAERAGAERAGIEHAAGGAADREAAAVEAARQAADAEEADAEAADAEEAAAEQAAAQVAQARALRDRVAEAAEQALAHAREVEREAARLQEAATDAEADAARRAREAEAASVRASQAASAAAKASEAATTAAGRADRARARAEEVRAQLREADALLASLEA
jgi:hypothetical protein